MDDTYLTFEGLEKVCSEAKADPNTLAMDSPVQNEEEAKKHLESLLARTCTTVRVTTLPMRGCLAMKTQGANQAMMANPATAQGPPV